MGQRLGTGARAMPHHVVPFDGRKPQPPTHSTRKDWKDEAQLVGLHDGDNNVTAATTSAPESTAAAAPTSSACTISDNISNVIFRTPKGAGLVLIFIVISFISVIRQRPAGDGIKAPDTGGARA